MPPAAAAALAPLVAASPSRNPFEVARSHLIRRLTELQCPPARAIADVGDHLREAANIFDEWLWAIGGQVQERVNADVDLRCFQGAFLAAIQGNADYEVECVVERASQYRTLRRAL